MNNKIILKCIDELKKETFSKEYVLGMLETFAEMSGVEVIKPFITNNIQPVTNNVKHIEKTEEEIYREQMLGGRVADTSIETVISLN